MNYSRGHSTLTKNLFHFIQIFSGFDMDDINLWVVVVIQNWQYPTENVITLQTTTFCYKPAIVVFG